MQIDFHFGVIYVLSRLAGFNRVDAEIISYSSQYVDDATNGGFVKFTNHPMYYRIRTAHKMEDTSNLDEQANQQSWMPFHFLPGNHADEDSEFGFVSRLICRPNSALAQEMIKECIRYKNDYNGLHRLGISLHVYADTWAHQGFAGIKSKVNVIQNLRDITEETEFARKIINPIADAYEATESLILDKYALGHAAAICNPDEPFAIWEYRNFADIYVRRNNPKDFLEAAENIFKVLQWYQLGDFSDDVKSLPQFAKEKLSTMLRSIQDENAWARCRLWLDAIEADEFGLGSEVVNYIAKGAGSWKAAALNTFEDKDKSEQLFEYNHAFENSNWKKFHDAAREHLNFVLYTLLPKHNIVY